MADKHPRIPAKVSRRPGPAPLPHWVLILLTPGSQAALQAVSDKKKPALMKKEAVLTCFAPVPGRSLFLSYN